MTRGQILATDPSPNINKAFSLMVQEEKQRHVVGFLSHSDYGQAVFAIKNLSKFTNVKAKASKKDRSLCSHCGILGHLVDKCHQLHDFPPSYGKGKGKQAVHHVFDTQQEDDTSSYPNQTAPMT